MNENCRVYGILTCTKLVQVWGRREVQEVLVIRELSRVTWWKVLANGVVAFEFFGDDDFEQRAWGYI